MILITILFITAKPLLNSYLTRYLIYNLFSVSGKYSADSALVFTSLSVLGSITALFFAFRQNLIKYFSRIEFTIIFLNILSLIQLPLVFIASTIAFRLSFYSIFISSISFYIISSYKSSTINLFKIYSILINMLFLILFMFAPALTTYRSLLRI